MARYVRLLLATSWAVAGADPGLDRNNRSQAAGVDFQPPVWVIVTAAGESRMPRLADRATVRESTAPGFRVPEAGGKVACG